MSALPARCHNLPKSCKNFRDGVKHMTMVNGAQSSRSLIVAISKVAIITSLILRSTASKTSLQWGSSYPNRGVGDSCPVRTAYDPHWGMPVGV